MSKVKFDSKPVERVTFEIPEEDFATTLMQFEHETGSKIIDKDKEIEKPKKTKEKVDKQAFIKIP